jgi:hypothetical protein
MGCTKVPLIDAVPIENYILSILHIIIGVGNSLLNVFHEWIEWRVEKLTQGEVTHRNTVAYAEVKVRCEKEKFEKWLENEGILLANKTSDKKRLSKEYSSKVVATLLYVINSRYIF